MHALRYVFSPFGRLSPPAFAIAAVAVYAAGAASQLLTLPDAIGRDGLWLFAIVQALLVWIWYAIHAKRLRDADRAVSLAAGTSALYALSIALLLIVAAAFMTVSAGTPANASATSALGLIMLVSILATLSGSNNHDFASLIVAILTAFAFIPIALAVAVTLWAATRPGATPPVA